MPVSAELVAARRRRGLSVEDLSAKTKIKIERICAIEAMAWQQLPTLVYLKGFLHAYATEVQLDPEKLTARYLDELNEVAPEYAEREAHPPAVPEGPFVVRESIWDRDPDLDDFYAMDVMRPEPVPVPELGPPPRALPPAPRKRSRRFVPAAFVGVVALVAGWAIGSYLHTIGKPFLTAVVMSHEKDPATETNAARLDRARQRVAEVAAEMAATSPLPASALPPVPVPLAEPVAPLVDASTGQAPAADAARVSGLDLSGWWALTNRLDSETAGAVTSLNLGFHLQLEQRGNRVSGTGRRWMENGRSIPAESRTEIEVDGTLIGRRLELNFVERGRRPSAGKFVMNVVDGDTLRGRFVNAAHTRGMSHARRMEPPSH